LADALAILGRIASLSSDLENITPLLALALVIAICGMCVRKEWYARAMEKFANCPFYVHAAAMLLVAFAIQQLGGRGNAPFVYSRF
jgi:hypothetical protein